MKSKLLQTVSYKGKLVVKWTMWNETARVRWTSEYADGYRFWFIYIYICTCDLIHTVPLT